MTGRRIGGSTFYGPRGAAYSSATDDWATPPHVFAALDRDFGFDLDVCASASNAKCSRYFTRDDDGLGQEWTGVVWCNPPYGRAIGDWLRKAADSAETGATVVCLIPAKTETVWWHEQVMARASEVRLVKGRIAFGDGTGSSTFGSAVVVYRAGCPRRCPEVPDFSAWERPEKPKVVKRVKTPAMSSDGLDNSMRLSRSTESGFIGRPVQATYRCLRGNQG